MKEFLVGKHSTALSYLQLCLCPYLTSIMPESRCKPFCLGKQPQCWRKGLKPHRSQHGYLVLCLPKAPKQGRKACLGPQ